MDITTIRNFAIIAHIDHGKSTLADRFLELTETIPPGKLQAQHLDRLSLEREKGITIKMQPVRMRWRPAPAKIINSKSEIPNKSRVQNTNSQNNLEFSVSDLKFADSEYILNLIDTPGHIDFAYEVSRALAAVEGVILLVDGTQGIQAQTLAHLELAKQLKLTVIPAINKIDMEIHQLDVIAADLVKLLELESEERIHLVSGKTGVGIEGLLRDVITRVPSPRLDPLPRGLIFDSHFDSYKGIVAHVRIFGGTFKGFSDYYLAANQTKFKSVEVGMFSPDLVKTEQLDPGEIGYIATGIRDPGVVKIGDTITPDQQSSLLPGYREPQPVIFVSIFPSYALRASEGRAQSERNFDTFKENIEKLLLNDPSVRIEPTNSMTFGRGYLVGCMGLLHLEIFQERLRREFKTPIVITLPSLEYEVLLKTNQVVRIKTLEELPRPDQQVELREPWAKTQIYAPFVYVERICQLVKENRGLLLDQTREGSFVMVRAELPLEELITGFFDDLKSISSGYASLVWEPIGYRGADLIRLDILVAEEVTPALSRIVARSRAETIGRKVVQELKELLPRGQFPIKLQAAIEGRIIARETIPALKKDVTGYLYGGDRTRKMKLWQKQQKGKKKLLARGTGRVNVPNDVLIKILRVK